MKRAAALPAACPLPGLNRLALLRSCGARLNHVLIRAALFGPVTYRNRPASERPISPPRAVCLRFFTVYSPIPQARRENTLAPGEAHTLVRFTADAF